MEELPSFLQSPSSTHIESRINSLSSSTPFSPSPKQKGTITELEEMQFAILFERALEMVSAGNAMTEVLKDDVRGFNMNRFLRWVHTDRTRQARYYEAQAIGAEIVADQMITIADAKDSVEDVNRSKLRIDVRKFLISTWNRKRFGEVKQVELSTSISITDALAEARGRVIDHAPEMIDVIEEVNTFSAVEPEERTYDEDDY